MAIQDTVQKLSAKMKVNNGLDAEGNVKTANVALPSFVTTATDAQIYAIADAAENLLTKTVVYLEKTITSYIDNNG